VSDGYTKIFRSMLTSSVWVGTSASFKVVWVTLLELADKDGIVTIGLPGLSKMAEVTLEECEQALVTLAAPDPYSASKELEGRRVVPVEGGWRIVNHGKYRHKLSAADRREYKRLHEQGRRDQRRAASTQTGATARRAHGPRVDRHGQT